MIIQAARASAESVIAQVAGIPASEVADVLAAVAAQAPATIPAALFSAADPSTHAAVTVQVPVAPPVVEMPVPGNHDPPSLLAREPS